MRSGDARADTASAAARSQAEQASASVVLALVCAAQFMVVLDVSVVNVAVPSIQQTLGLSTAGLQWVASAYALTFAGFLLLGGRLADLYGRQQVFTTGVALFSVASLVGGLATGPVMLIAARAAQGLGAAVLAPATLTVLTASFPEGTRRTRALATWTAVSLAGGAAGNLVGGVITQYLSWRWILLINVPLGVVAIVAALRSLTGEHRAGQGGRLDLPGAVLVTTGLASLTYGLSQAPDAGWADPVTLVSLALGVLSLGSFWWVEARWSSEPLIPPRLLQSRAVWLGNVVVLVVAAGFQIPMWYFLTLYMQQILGYGALQAGAAFLPHTVLSLVVGLGLTPRLMRVLPARTLVTAGAVFAAVGFVWQSRITPSSDYLTGIALPAVLIATGGGLLNTPLTATVTSGVPPANAGAASGLMNTAKQVGGVLGLAVLLVFAGTSGEQGVIAVEYSRAFLAIAACLAAVAVIALALPPHRDTTSATSAPHGTARS